MRICITATGNSLDAQADSSFGRAPWLLVIETDDNALIVEAIENRGFSASQGAGIAAAQIIADKGVQALLTGRVGPKAQPALQAAGVKIFENVGSGTVREVLGRFIGGTYQEATGRISETRVGCVQNQNQNQNQGQGKGVGRNGRGRGRGMGQGRRGGM